ncbi:MAG: autotransporter domain-containing protein, partial [Candidatus Thiodiazotropha sp.]
LFFMALFSMSASADYNVAPTSLAFGGVEVNTSSNPMTVTFTNTNDWGGAIEIDSISATGPFSVTHNCPLIANNLRLTASASCTITVVYSPTAAANDNGTLSIIGDNNTATGGTFSQEIGLSGTGIVPSTELLNLKSNDINFGTVPANILSSAIPVTLVNTENATVSISSITATSPFTQTHDCPRELGAHESCTIQVRVDSATLGRVTGTLAVTGRSATRGSDSDSIALSATIQAALLSVMQTSLTFEDTEVGSTSASQTVTFSNQGNLALQSVVVSVEGDFTQSSDCPATLNPGVSCDVKVMAGPASAGDLTGSLQISALNGSQSLSESVSLMVHATDPVSPPDSVKPPDPANPPDLVTSVTSLDFADAVVDAETQPQTLTLTNPGSVAVTINGIATEGDFSQSNNCGTSLTAGASCEIQVIFTPQAEGMATGALSVDTVSGISRITLTGAAAAAAPSNPVADLLEPYTGGNPNLQSLAKVIGEACPSGRLGARLQADCDAVVDAAINGDPKTARALQQVTPESATKAGNVSRQGGETQVRNLGSRISALRAGARGVSLNGLDWRIEGQDLPIELLAEAYRRSQGGGASADNALFASRLGVFVTGDIASGSKDETDLESGLDFDTYGLTLGADYRINDQFILGGAFGIMNTQADLNNNTGDLDTQGYSLSLYGTYYSEQNYFVDFAGSYGVNNFDQTRNIVYQLDNLANVNQKFDAEYDGNMYSLFVGSGYDFTRSVWAFGPRVDLEYVRSNVDGFSEEASNVSADGGGWATRVEDMDQTWLTLNLGGRMSYTHSADWAVLIPYARLDWMHEFKDDSQTVNAYFVDDPSPQAIRITSDDPDRDYMRLRVGASAQFQNGLVGFVDFGTLFANSRWSSNNLSLGVRMAF